MDGQSYEVIAEIAVALAGFSGVTTALHRRAQERRSAAIPPCWGVDSAQVLSRGGEEDALVPTILGRLLCLLGIHDFRILEVTYGFAPGSDVQRLECRRCGRITTTSG